MVTQNMTKNLLRNIKANKNIGSLATKMKDISRRFKMGPGGRKKLNATDDSSWMKDVINLYYSTLLTLTYRS